MPKEHGGYGQLVLPLLTALGSGRPTAAAFLYAAAAVLAFCAHEPLLVLLGQRGSRALREVGGRARVRLALLFAGALLCSALALLLSRPAACLAFAAPVGGALMIGFLIWQKQERTTSGEIVAACALSAAGLPVALASGLSAPQALGAWGVFSIGFGFITVSLRRAIYGRKTAARAENGSLAIPLLMGGAFCFVVRISVAIAVAALPMAGVALGLLFMPQAPKRLQRIGWLLMMSTVATGVLLVQAARHAGP